MSSISFRGRKNGEPFDAGFYLWNGEALSDASAYCIGDLVGVCFADQHAKQDAILEHCPDGFTFYGSDGFVQVRCVVVQRHHSIVWKSVGKFQELSRSGIVLEAESGYWEDVLRWIVLDERPPWIPEQ